MSESNDDYYCSHVGYDVRACTFDMLTPCMVVLRTNVFGRPLDQGCICGHLTSRGQEPRRRSTVVVGCATTPRALLPVAGGVGGGLFLRCLELLPLGTFNTLRAAAFRIGVRGTCLAGGIFPGAGARDLLPSQESRGRLTHTAQERFGVHQPQPGCRYQRPAR